MRKICFKCGKKKDLDLFYKHNQMGDGHLNKCIECTKKDVFIHRNNNLEKIRLYDRIRHARPENVKRKALSTKKFRKRFPDKYKAHSVLGGAIRNKSIIRPKYCSICYLKKKVEDHHDDYSKPLDVVWMCSACHSQLHRDLNQIKKEK